MYFGRCVLCSRATVHPPTPTQLICIVPAFLCSPMHTQQGVRGPTRSYTTHTDLHVRLTCITRLSVHALYRHTEDCARVQARGTRIYARPVERYVSSDRTTVAGKPEQARSQRPNASPFLSPIPPFSFLLFSSLFFSSQRQPNEAKTARGTHRRRPGFLFSEAEERSGFFPPDCSVYCISKTAVRKRVEKPRRLSSEIVLKL